MFCGAGGFSYGFHQAGFDIVLGVDNNPKLGTTFTVNHPGAEFLCEDILKLDTSVLGRPDVVIGSPPCQALSTINPNYDTERGLILVRRFIEIVRELSPRYWIGENVNSVCSHIRPIVLPDRVCVLDAVDFGIPQFRKRCFFGKFPVPEPTHSDCGQVGLNGDVRRPWRVLKEVLEEPSDLFLTPKALAALTKHKDRPGYSVVFPDPLDRPSRTVLASSYRHTQNTFIVVDRGHERILTVREHARLQGFPDAFLWFARYYDAIQMIGNAVPPPLSQALAEAILKQEEKR